MFEKVEKKFNTILVRHAFSYISASKVDKWMIKSNYQITIPQFQSGISDNELEDVLSLDDKVLNSIYEDVIPDVSIITYN